MSIFDPSRMPANDTIGTSELIAKALGTVPDRGATLGLVPGQLTKRREWIPPSPRSCVLARRFQVRQIELAPSEYKNLSSKINMKKLFELQKTEANMSSSSS